MLMVRVTYKDGRIELRECFDLGELSYINVDTFTVLRDERVKK